MDKEENMHIQPHIYIFIMSVPKMQDFFIFRSPFVLFLITYQLDVLNYSTYYLSCQ